MARAPGPPTVRFSSFPFSFPSSFSPFYTLGEATLLERITKLKQAVADAINRQEVRLLHHPQERAKRQVPGARGEHRPTPGPVGGRGPDLPQLRADRGDRRRQRDSGTFGRISRCLPGHRPWSALVVLPHPDFVYRTGPGCLVWLEDLDFRR